MERELSLQDRVLSAAEFIIGAAIVIEHNVYHRLCNEVFILLVAGWISLWWRNGGWNAVGMAAPKSWWKTIAIAISAATLLQLGSELIVAPLASHYWPAPQHVSKVLGAVSLGWKQASIALLIVWTFAAFGEEMSYRGYLLRRGAEIPGPSKASYCVAMIAVSILFGFGHYYKGPAGVVDSTYSGLVLGTAYLLSGRNLWAAILAHGLSDTFAVIALCFGWGN